MIRFRTIDPETAANTNAAPAPAVVAPQPAPEQAEQTRAAVADAKAKGLTRKTPLRAKKRDAAPLFDEKAPAAGSADNA